MRENKILPLHMAANYCVGIARIDFGVTNRFLRVGKFTNMESANNYIYSPSMITQYQRFSVYSLCETPHYVLRIQNQVRHCQGDRNLPVNHFLG